MYEVDTKEASPKTGKGVKLAFEETISKKRKRGIAASEEAKNKKTKKGVKLAFEEAKDKKRKEK